MSVVSQLLQVSEQESTDKGIDEQMPEDCESANQIEEAASGSPLASVSQTFSSNFSAKEAEKEG